MVICDSKATQLEEYMAERKGDARILLNAPGFIDAAARLDGLLKTGKGTTDEYRAGVAAVRPRLAAFADANSYANCYLFDPDGEHS